MADPFTETYAGLWAILEGWPGFTELVLEKNRIKFSGFGGNRKQPSRDSIQAAGFPQVSIIPIDSVRSYPASNRMSILQRYDIQVLAGDLSLDSLYPLSWEVFRALRRWRDHLSSLTWSSHAFVRNLRLSNVLDTRLFLSNHRGWVSIWAVEVDMWLPISLLVTP